MTKKAFAGAMKDFLKPSAPRRVSSEPYSVVGQVKEAYRRASKGQRAQLRAWMRRVLSGEDGNDGQPLDRQEAGR